MGDIALVDRAGRLLASVGDGERVTYARSSAKPLQTLPLVESGAADAFAMSDEEIALCCASHSGEEMHVTKVRAFLNRIGVPESALQCGVHPPYHQPSYEALLRSGTQVSAIHNNCSGKHAGMLALAKFLGADLDTYLDVNHPVQQAVLSVVREVCDLDESQLVLGTDGCGVPVFGMPIRNLALAFARFADPEDMPDGRARAMRRIARAMMSHPHLVAGTDRFCTALMQAGQGTLLGKAGAEGVYCVGIAPQGFGLCVKVDDGNARAAYPSVVEALRQAQVVDKDVIDALASFHRPQLKNHQGTVVGSLQTAFTLRPPHETDK
ncbi:asparaginase [Alicyclobacillus cycloheptanicus]|nr:asparaginase [Alicyclobacillus cycloheptanicus]